MSITEKIIEEMKNAMRNKEKLRLETLRTLKAALQTDKSQGDLSEAQETDILNKQLKRRYDAIEMYKKGGREELAEKEASEAEIIKEFLPEQFSEDKIMEIIEAAYTNGVNMGDMMKSVMPQTKGRADGKLVSQLVKNFMSKKQ
jgi:uncharacterized protein YqeY